MARDSRSPLRQAAEAGRGAGLELVVEPDPPPRRGPGRRRRGRPAARRSAGGPAGRPAPRPRPAARRWPRGPGRKAALATTYPEPASSPTVAMAAATPSRAARASRPHGGALMATSRRRTARPGPGGPGAGGATSAPGRPAVGVAVIAGRRPSGTTRSIRPDQLGAVGGHQHGAAVEPRVEGGAARPRWWRRGGPPARRAAPPGRRAAPPGRWPPGPLAGAEGEPALAHRGVEAGRQLGHQVAQAGHGQRLRAARRSPAVGVAQAQVVGQRAAEQVGVAGAPRPAGGASAAGSTGPGRRRPTGPTPASGRTKPSRSGEHRRLAGPRRPDQGHVLAGGERAGRSRSSGRRRAPRVDDADAGEVRRWPGHVGQVGRAGPPAPPPPAAVDGQVQDVEDALGRRLALGCWRGTRRRPGAAAGRPRVTPAARPARWPGPPCRRAGAGPSTMATSPTPMPARNSRARAERKATRRVPMVVWRRPSVASATSRRPWPARPKARRVGRPWTSSKKRAESEDSRRHWRRVSVADPRPNRTMATGTRATSAGQDQGRDPVGTGHPGQDGQRGQRRPATAWGR